MSWAALAARGRHAQRVASRYRQMRGRRIVNLRGRTPVHDARMVRKSGTTALVKVKAWDWPVQIDGQRHDPDGARTPTRKPLQRLGPIA